MRIQGDVENKFCAVLTNFLHIGLAKAFTVLFAQMETERRQGTVLSLVTSFMTWQPVSR